MLFSTFVIGNDSFYGQNADEEAGFMRNLIGIVDLVNSEDLSQGSTLALLGLSLFFLLFISMFKGCYLYSEEHDKSLYMGIGIFFLLFSLTDGGFWDFFFFSFVFIYTFSIKSNKAQTRMPISI